MNTCYGIDLLHKYARASIPLIKRQHKKKLYNDYICTMSVGGCLKLQVSQELNRLTLRHCMGMYVKKYVRI